MDIPDPDILKEFKTFVINDRGKPEAAPGHHDDHVLAAAIALYNIDSATTFKARKEEDKQSDVTQKPIYDVSR